MTFMEGIPTSDVQGPGWRIDSKTGKKWFRIVDGTPEFDSWMKFYKQNGQGLLANFLKNVEKKTYVMGPDPAVSGTMQLSYLNSIPTKS